MRGIITGAKSVGRNDNNSNRLFYEMLRVCKIRWLTTRTELSSKLVQIIEQIPKDVLYDFLCDYAQEHEELAMADLRNACGGSTELWIYGSGDLRIYGTMELWI